jgi:hypothetical protein
VEEYVPSEGTVGIGMIYDQADATMELDTLVLPLVVESQH